MEKLNGPHRDDELMLRPLVGRDAGELFMLVDAHRAALARWLPWVPFTQAVADSTFYIMSLTGFWKTGLAFGLFVEGELAGTVGFQQGDERNKKVELGYWLAPTWQRRGIASRAVRLLLAAAFKHSTVHRIAAKVQPDNLASIALLERVGFSFEGLERQGVKFPQGYRDHRIYSLLSSEIAE